MWENRDNLAYAWRILNQGVCDGCSLEAQVCSDDVIDGIHVCTSRLKLLRMNTQPALDPAELSDIERLRRMSNKDLQDLGRLPYPMVYRPGDKGFSRVSWDDALNLIGDKLRDTAPQAPGMVRQLKGITNESYYTFTQGGSRHGHEQCGSVRGWPPPRPWRASSAPSAWVRQPAR